MTTREFLKEKGSQKFYNRWSRIVEKCDPGYTNISVISDNVFRFTEYNLLPSNEDDILCGHYDFYINLKTFEYCIYKSSNYGSLDYTLPLREPAKMLSIDELPEITKNIVEAYIANKMVDAHYGFYPDQKYLFGEEEIFRYGSVICDDRKYIWSNIKANSRSEMDLLALKLIDKNFIQDSFKSIEYVGKKYFKGEYFDKEKTMIVLQAIIKTQLGKEYSIVYKTYLRESCFYIGEIINGNKNNINYDIHYSLNCTISDVYKAVPNIIESMA